MIKKNISENFDETKDNYIIFKPSTRKDMNIVHLDINKDKEKIMQIYNNVVKNENLAQVFVLCGAYIRGEIHHRFKLKLESNGKFISYCFEYLKIWTYSTDSFYSLMMRFLPAKWTERLLKSNLIQTTLIQTETSFVFYTKYF